MNTDMRPSEVLPDAQQRADGPVRQWPTQPKLGVFGILQRGNQFLLAKREPTDPAFPDKWGFPGGGVEFLERLEVALQREFAEEVHLDGVSIGSYRAIHEHITETRHVVLIFMQVFTDGYPIAGDGQSEIGWFNFMDIVRMADAGKTTPLTLTAIDAFCDLK